ncbi:hypothetical protein EMIT0324P_90011 [Pseudomonas chlororaphis]
MKLIISSRPMNSVSFVTGSNAQPERTLVKAKVSDTAAEYFKVSLLDNLWMLKPTFFQNLSFIIQI